MSHLSPYVMLKMSNTSLSIRPFRIASKSVDSKPGVRKTPARDDGPSKNQGSDQVFFTILQADGTFKPVTRLAKMAGQ